MNKYQKRQGRWKSLFNPEDNSNSKDLDIRLDAIKDDLDS